MKPAGIITEVGNDPRLAILGDDMKILVACEYSGRVRDAFIAKGHEAMSCDLLPTESPGPHYQGDVMDIIHAPWDMMLAFPDCTYLTNAGVRWLYNRDGSLNLIRWGKMVRAAYFYKSLLEFKKIKKRVIENPRMHKYAVEIIGSRADQFVHPWWFGHGETKATGLHLRGAKKLKPTNIVEGREARIHKMPPGPNRGKDRSLILPGLATAFAEQWG